MLVISDSVSVVDIFVVTLRLILAEMVNAVSFIDVINVQIKI